MISPTNKTQVRVAYVYDGALHHAAACWRKVPCSVPCAAQFCAATNGEVVVSRKCRGAKIDYFQRTWKKLLHNVMQYSAEGSKPKAPKSHLRVHVVQQRPTWRNKFNLTNRNVTIITLAPRTAAPTKGGSVQYNNCIRSDIK